MLFIIFLIASLGFLCGVIGSAVIAIQHGVTIDESQVEPQVVKLYSSFLFTLSLSFLFRILLTFVTFFLNVLPAYSRHLQSAYIFDKYKIGMGINTKCVRAYWWIFPLPFFEFYGILADPLRFLIRINKGEVLSVPNYPKWFDENDDPEKMFEKYKNSSRFIAVVFKPISFKKK